MESATSHFLTVPGADALLTPGNVAESFFYEYPLRLVTLSFADGSLGMEIVPNLDS
jgi:hypothetical protein